MEFIKFSSLDNTYRQNLIDKLQYEGKDDGLWIATEKLHGANFSFWCDGTEVKVASRTQFVDGTFYNCQAVINKYSDKVLEITRGIAAEGQTLVIYGELFGGNVQKEVEYGEKDFRAFDVLLDGIPQHKTKNLINFLKAGGISFVPILHIGTLAGCLTIENTFKSTLTPECYLGENNAEGLVIEPVIPTWFNNGSRVYFKNKTASFSEKKAKPKNEVFELSDEESDLLNELLSYNTEQRVSNVISKIGAVTNKDFGRILGLTTQDILEEFTKETERDPKTEAEDNWKQFLKLLQAAVGKTVREQFVKALD